MTLLDVERTGSWRETSTSFSKWIEEQEDELGKSPQSLWRYLSAGREYIEQRKALSARGVRLPKLEDVSAAVSPESIELLSKIRRVAPASLLKEIGQDVLTGKIERKVLRGIWDSYAPLLEGKTARGRGAKPQAVKAPRAVREVSDSLAGLRRSAGHWLASDMSLFELFTREDLGAFDQGQLPGDALMVSRERGSNDVLIHGVVLHNSIETLGPSVTRALALAALVDRCWLVTARAFVAADLDKIDAEVGALTVSAKTVRLVRHPMPTARRRTLGEEVTRRILGRLRK
ncbi:MAG: hypothetical protein ACT4P0_02930 [Panacagrimonas sp.]